MDFYSISEQNFNYVNLLNSLNPNCAWLIIEFLLFVQDGFPLMTLFNKSLVGSVLVWNRIYRKKVNNLLKHFSLIGCLKCELWWPNTECCQMLVDCKMKERTTSWCSLIRQHVDHFWHLLRKWVGLESQNKSGPIFFANDHCVKIS